MRRGNPTVLRYVFPGSCGRETNDSVCETKNANPVFTCTCSILRPNFSSKDCAFLPLKRFCRRISVHFRAHEKTIGLLTERLFLVHSAQFVRAMRLCCFSLARQRNIQVSIRRRNRCKEPSNGLTIQKGMVLSGATMVQTYLFIIPLSWGMATAPCRKEMR